MLSSVAPHGSCSLLLPAGSTAVWAEDDQHLSQAAACDAAACWQFQLDDSPAGGHGLLLQHTGGSRRSSLPSPSSSVGCFASLTGSRLFGVRGRAAATPPAPAGVAPRPPSSSAAAAAALAGAAAAALDVQQPEAASYAEAREAGLRAAFSAFNRGSVIRVDDLAASLARVTICCPSDGCVLRPRAELVAGLMQRLNVEADRQLTFAEFRDCFMLLPEQELLVEFWLSDTSALRCADMGCHFSILDTSTQRRGSPWGHLLAGAVAGAASRSATAPLETLRMAAMSGALPANMSLWEAGRALVAGSGGSFRVLFAGNAVNVLRSAPARALDFFGFEVFKSWLGNDAPSKTFAAAGLAGTLSWTLLYPLETIRSRLTLSRGTYAGIRHCAATMLVNEGWRSFYRGLGASLLAIGPEAAVTYGLHDLLKRQLREAAHGREPGVPASLACGVVAAWSGQLLAFPMESVSRRMQLASANAAAAAAAAVAGSAAAGPGAAALSASAAGSTQGVLQVLRAIIQDGGPQALYRGLGAATLRLVPSAIVSFGTYELGRAAMLALESEREVAQARACCQQLHSAPSSAQRCSQHIQQQQELGAAGSSSSSLPVQPLLLDGCCCDGSPRGATTTSSSKPCGSSPDGSSGVQGCATS